jgi:hypothetical protein
MKNLFTFEAEPFPTSPLGEIGGLEEEFAGEDEQFLGWFGETRIVDHTAFTPKDKRKSVRDN